MGIGHRFEHFDDMLNRGGGRDTTDAVRHWLQREHKLGRPLFERNARDTTDAVLHWLQRERKLGRPLFLWVLYMDPHGPYQPPADWKRSFVHSGPISLDPNRVPGYLREHGVTDPLEYVDLYYEEIAYTDSQINRLLRDFERQTSLGKALVILTSDHGETMANRERWFSHSYHVYEELIRVPLTLRGRGVEAGRRSGLASGIDIAPTILGFAGVDVPASLPGLDLRSEGSISPDRIVFAEAIHFFGRRQWRAAIQGNHKWMIRLKREEPFIRARRFYDLAADPRELKPQRVGVPVCEELVELAETDPDPAGWPLEPQLGKLGQELRNILHALGYVE